MTTRPAIEIAEELLDRTGRGLDSGDFDLFADAFALPYRHDTFDATVEITDLADIRSVYDQVRRHFRQIGVTRIIRFCVAADYQTPDKILSTHESHMFSGSHRIRPPYPVLSTLERRDGAWKITASNYAIGEDPAHAAAMLPKEKQQTSASHAAPRAEM
ncbi:hypothetical protein [Marivita hallyeonensis]|uniref:SnoaL-like domain-containing protein n=1 Tax=Marivita hallyeonensis TaxID=996342 RepID=A0A1M5NQ70_9RHOB|nr:hypothetical protein [Marivita hallyeonensis]SHG91701.1 hypothetical protein SAMN05443551_1009 [Marivita hallyeonensis]